MELARLTTELQEVRSQRDLERHPTFKELRHILKSVLGRTELFPPRQAPRLVPREIFRVAAWNIERGMAFDGVLDVLRSHPELSDADVLLLTEVDHGMARSGNRHVARDLGEALHLHAAFGPCVFNLDKGNGFEKKAEGENTAALQGHAILSRYPLEDLELVSLPRCKDHLSGEERQIGRERALIATAKTPKGPLHVASVHLSAHSSRKQRLEQMKAVVEALERRPGPALIGGDWNTSTYNANRAVWAILGFWRRVAMGVRHVMRSHYPYPERYFERKLFRYLDRRGFQTAEFNLPGECTVHYDFNDLDPNLSLSDWVPQWCFKYINWALEPFNGRCSFKLDWFAGRNLTPSRPLVIRELPKKPRRLSDHDPIMIDVQIRGTHA